MAAIFDGMSDREIVDILEFVDEKTKKEVPLYMRKYPGKYRFILETVNPNL